MCIYTSKPYMCMCAYIHINIYIYIHTCAEYTSLECLNMSKQNRSSCRGDGSEAKCDQAYRPRNRPIYWQLGEHPKDFGRRVYGLGRRESWISGCPRHCNADVDSWNEQCDCLERRKSQLRISHCFVAPASSRD